jgi:asparagine synthase (glutamine-hydrolysing)
MCGIAGFWVNSSYNFDSEIVLTNMTTSLNHRGPDSFGNYLDNVENLGLGHARLSILDLSSAGHQPMISVSERYIITYNGEIYNHNDIRADLDSQSAKISWQGTSDTETLLAAIDLWGLDKAIGKCKGMFAFALWDKKQKKLFFVRDRMGEKPLYFFKDDEKVIFASELKAIRSYSDTSFEINNEAVKNFFDASYIKDPDSIYSNIHKVPPGNIVEFSAYNHDPKIYPFWSLEKFIKNNSSINNQENFQQNVNDIDDLLKNVISSQMISDVPLGSFLSGGIDSSLVTSIMQNISGNNVKTFSIGFDQDQYNEAQFAEKIASYLGTDHKSFYISELDALEVIPQLAKIYDEPFADYSQIPTLLLCREARKHVTVALTGDGADEIFGGYNRYIFAPKIWRLISQFPPSIRKQVKFLGKAAQFFSNNQNSFINSVLKKSGLPISSMDRLQHLSDILGSARNFESLFEGLVSTFNMNERLFIRKAEYTNISAFDLFSKSHLSLSRQMMFADSQSYLPGDILTKVDRASMSVSLETRAPFLDQRIVEKAWLLDDQHLFRKRTGKFLLREILSKYIPRHLFERPKQGFTIPIDNWLRNDLKEWGEDLLSSEKIKFFNLLNEAEVSKIWNEHQSKRFNHGHKLWTILMFQLWLEQWSN